MKAFVDRPQPSRYVLALPPVTLFGVAIILATAPEGATAPASAYYYANWNCNNSAQCITVMGNNTGSAGPFCTKAPCDSWRQTYFFGATCTTSNAYVIRARTSGTCGT